MGAVASQITNLTIVCPTVYSCVKHQSSASLTFVRGFYRWPIQRASNVENVSIWWRHRGPHKMSCAVFAAACVLTPSDFYWCVRFFEVVVRNVTFYNFRNTMENYWSHPKSIKWFYILAQTSDLYTVPHPSPHPVPQWRWNSNKTI